MPSPSVSAKASSGTSSALAVGGFGHTSGTRAATVTMGTADNKPGSTLPQHTTSSLGRSAHALPTPTATAVASHTSATGNGTALLVVPSKSPKPSWPTLPNP